jgi:hypothetical protein
MWEWCPFSKKANKYFNEVIEGGSSECVWEHWFTSKNTPQRTMYQIDFMEMTQVNPTSGTIRRIRAVWQGDESIIFDYWAHGQQSAAAEEQAPSQTAPIALVDASVEAPASEDLPAPTNQEVASGSKPESRDTDWLYNEPLDSNGLTAAEGYVYAKSDLGFEGNFEQWKQELQHDPGYAGGKPVPPMPPGWDDKWGGHRSFAQSSEDTRQQQLAEWWVESGKAFSRFLDSWGQEIQDDRVFKQELARAMGWHSKWKAVAKIVSRLNE